MSETLIGLAIVLALCGISVGLTNINETLKKLGAKLEESNNAD